MHRMNSSALNRTTVKELSTLYIISISMRRLSVLRPQEEINDCSGEKKCDGPHLPFHSALIPLGVYGCPVNHGHGHRDNPPYHFRTHSLLSACLLYAGNSIMHWGESQNGERYQKSSTGCDNRGYTFLTE